MSAEQRNEHIESIVHHLRGVGAAASCRLSVQDLVCLVAAIFVRAGVPAEQANILAQTCTHAERDGAHSHGLHRIPAYLATLTTDWVTPGAAPEIQEAASGTLLVDARNGFAQPALIQAMPLLMRMASESGVAILLMKNSHHFGALWLDVEPLAERGFVALTMVNSTSHMAPIGGTKPVYGTNPMAFACPREGHLPIVFDQATSVMAKGDIQLAANSGRLVPPGTGLDKFGKPTENPADILDGGTLLPFSGHKGSSIAMMVEVLAAALTGGSFSWEINKSGYTNAHTSRAGQFLLCIDPGVSGQSAFTARIDTLARMLLDSGQSRMPGERRYANRKQSERDGVEVNPIQLLSWYDSARPYGA